MRNAWAKLPPRHYLFGGRQLLRRWNNSKQTSPPGLGPSDFNPFWLEVYPDRIGAGMTSDDLGHPFCDFLRFHQFWVAAKKILKFHIAIGNQ
jgi:hypothetical protein